MSPIRIERRKWIECSDRFDHFIRDFRKQKEMKLDMRISIPKATDLLIDEIGMGIRIQKNKNKNDNISLFVL